jgi:hypothetical protein
MDEMLDAGAKAPDSDSAGEDDLVVFPCSRCGESRMPDEMPEGCRDLACPGFWFV